MNPLVALLIGIVALVFLGWVFWPEKGLISMLASWRLNNKRVLLEDALKFIFDREYKNRPCGLDGIAGNTNIPGNKAAKLLNHLQAIGLIKLEDENFRLTEAGRSYALQIIRIHRIWEKYLADETGIGQMHWHKEADSIEHQISSTEADQLAAKLGNPVFDPHGDPIPTSEGKMPLYVGQPLSTLKKGDIGRIVHIEDEPHTIYAQLVALDLYPGVQIYVMDVSDGKIHFAANGEECVLTPLFASSITVEVIPEEKPLQKKYQVLSSLRVGEQAEVVGISAGCRGQQRRRLMDLGIIPGTVISAELKSAAGDPVGYRVLGTTIAIRADQADNIFIKQRKEKL